MIFSNTFDDHVKHVEQVLTALKGAEFSLNMEKRKFFSETVDYLGHVVRPGKLAVVTKNTDAVKGFAYPRTQTGLLSFLGLCNVYRRFVPNFTRVAAPLNRILRKGEPVELLNPTEEHNNVFEALRASLTCPPMLLLPRPDLPYSVDMDGCKDQIGCALMQADADGTGNPIGFWSRSLNPAERNYSTGERKCLAVVWAV